MLDRNVAEWRLSNVKLGTFNTWFWVGQVHGKLSRSDTHTPEGENVHGWCKKLGLALHAGEGLSWAGEGYILDKPLGSNVACSASRGIKEK